MSSYDEDIKMYAKLLARFNDMQENDYMQAYNLHKEALVLYDRFSYILYDYRKCGGKDTAIKNRMEDILKVLSNIYTSSKMVFNKAKEDLNRS